jgi:HD-GYP domain-containing protein (c-di-GMP phosphodiesterase class II)
MNLLGGVTYPVKHLRWKIIVPFGILTVLLALAGTYVTSRLVAGSLDERFQNQLAEAARVTSDSIVRREQKHLELVRAITFTDGVAAAAAREDADGLQALILPLAANAGQEDVEVVDPGGHQIFGAALSDPHSLTYVASNENEAFSTWQPFRSVVDTGTDELGDKYVGIVQTSAGPALFTAGPIFNQDKLIGVVLVGSPLSSLLSAVKLEALGDVTLYDTLGLPIASTLPLDGLDSPDELRAAPSVLNNVGSDSAVRESRDLFGRSFDFLYGQMSLRGDLSLRYSVALPSQFISSAASITRWQMAALFTAATAAVLLTGLIVAHAITRPVLQLVKTAEAVSGGDLSARSGVSTHDEVGRLAKSFDEMTAHLQRQHIATIKALASAIDARDPYTLGHSLRVGQLSFHIGKRLGGLTSGEPQQLEIGGYLHDIGKIGVRDSVLLKPGYLTPDERRLIEDHPTIGMRIVEPIDLAEPVLQVVGGHHERLDGSGYPYGLRGPEVSIFARISAVADVFDALTSDRPYRSAMSDAQVLEILFREVQADHLDPRVVETLVRLVPEWKERLHSDKGLQVPSPLADFGRMEMVA